MPSLARRVYGTLRARAHRLTSRLHALPDFIIVGAAKAGTTSLYFYLSSHPKIYPATKKEVHYFDLNFPRGEHWYRRHFPPALRLKLEGAITGEASPYYLYHPHVPGRIAHALPDVKLIVCLRNPVDRALSHYWHVVRAGNEPLAPEEALDMETESLRIGEEKARLIADGNYDSRAYRIHSYLDRGIYADQIAAYQRYFPASQLLILKSEDLFADTQGTCDSVLDFLGLDHHPLPTDTVQHKGSYEQDVKPETRERLAAFYEPHNQRLYDLLGVDAAWW